MPAELDTKQKTIAKPNSAPAKVSLEKFLRITEGKFAEWVDGEVIYMSVSDPYQDRVEFLSGLMRLLAEEKKLGKVRTAPYSMKIPRKRIVREPDIMFVAAANRAIAGSRYADGPADLIVEVVSDDSVTRDNRDKFREYEAAGVREYWVIDSRPGRHIARLYVLDEGRYFEVMPDELGIYRSTVLEGFWLDVAWLWEEQPRSLAAWTEIAATLPAPRVTTR